MFRFLPRMAVPSSYQRAFYLSSGQKTPWATYCPGSFSSIVSVSYTHLDVYKRQVYEGELREGRTEYEFKIDASTGNFIQWEQDWD